VKIFELLALRSEEDQRVAILEPFAQGLNHYRAQEWELAELKFNQVLASLPDDVAARLYLQRIVSLREDPPKPGWDGVYTMTRK
jgi:adenylate cyclase